MASFINSDNGSVSGVSGLKYSADSSGVLVLQTNGTTALTIDTSQNVTFAGTVSFASGSFTNLAYTGTLTGGTGVVNLGSGQFYKDASGNVGIGTTSPANILELKATAPGLIINGTSSTAFRGVSIRSNGTEIATMFAEPNAGENRITAGFSGFGGFQTLWTNGAERMRIDSSGNVGIGTTTTTSGKLNVKASTGGTALYATDSVNADFFIDFPSSQISRITSQYGTGGVLAFAIGSSKIEAMRIDSSGNLLINQTTGGEKLGITGTTNNYAVRVNGANTSGTYYQIAFNAGFGGSQVGTIVSTGSTTAYNTSSDYRLKENIAPITGALNTVSALKPVTYDWKVDGSAGQGFIAHELAEIVPECVTGEKDAIDEEGKPVYQGIDTSFLVATLVAAIQELNAKVTALEAKLAAK